MPHVPHSGGILFSPVAFKGGLHPALSPSSGSTGTGGSAGCKQFFGLHQLVYRHACLMDCSIFAAVLLKVLVKMLCQKLLGQYGG